MFSFKHKFIKWLKEAELNNEKVNKKWVPNQGAHERVPNQESLERVLYQEMAEL